MAETISQITAYCLGSFSSDIWKVASHPTGAPLMLNVRTGESLSVTDVDVTNGDNWVQATGAAVSPLYSFGQLVKIKGSNLVLAVSLASGSQAGAGSAGNVYIGRVLGAESQVGSSKPVDPPSVNFAMFFESDLGPVIGTWS